MTRYECDLVAFNNIGDATVVCPHHAEMLDEIDSELLFAEESKYYRSMVAKLIYLT